MTRVAWTQERVNNLSPAQAAKLRQELSNQSLSRDPVARREVFKVLDLLKRRPDKALTPAERASDAAEFLRPSAVAADARQRAWDAALELRGGDEKACRRAGYRPPSEAA